jgi:hypothetical protein
MWDIEHLAGLSAEAEKARLNLETAVKKITETVERLTQKAAATAIL